MLPTLLRRTALPLLAGLLVSAAVPALATGGTAAAATPLASAVSAVSLLAADPARLDERGVPLLAPLTDFTQQVSRRTTVRPTAYAAARLDLGRAREVLADTPTVEQVTGGAAPTVISLTSPSGAPAAFAVAEDSVMAPGLQAAHPELRTYSGTGITDPTDTIRFSVTPLGLHASVRSLETHRTWYVDPAYQGRGVSAHLSYLRGAVPASERAFAEGRPVRPAGAVVPARTLQRRAGEVVVQRTYRMAFITEQTYAAYFGSANVLATKVIQVDRADHIYMDDMAIKFVLAEGTDKLNLDTDAKAIGANGPCGASACYTADETASCGGNVLDRNKFVAGQIVGADRFDIGHFGSGDGSGGVAYLGVVGGADKAGGCTALDPPAGDFYAIDFFAHEVGHQMGGNHTFDGNNGSCAAPNRNADTSVEPGSGSSVMAYAGICLSDDLQPHTDPYFSQRSIDEFTALTTATPTALAEEQVVSLTSLGAGDTFQLTYPGAAPQTITMGTNYTAAGLQAAVLALTGKASTVTAYDGASALDANGFTIAFTGLTDLQRLGVGATTGDVTGVVGVTQNGGPITNGGAPTTTTNHRPVVTAPADKTIPVQTPFTLTGSATDAEAAQRAGLTYLWEQNDAGNPGDPVLGTGPGTLLGQPTKLIGPLFRVFGVYADVTPEGTLMYESPGENLATTAPSRTFPDLQQILDGDTNAEGACPPATTDPSSAMEGATLDCYSEFLPDPAYAAVSGALNFRLTVRDGALVGGGTGFDDVSLTVDPSVGPFLVTSRGTTGTTATAGATETVTWDAAGTNTADLAENVKISISIDGGLTYPFVAAATTPNDGTEDIVLPSVSAEKARIKVEALGNYFFDVNNADFAITGGVQPPVVEAPQTRITGGVVKNGFLVGDRATYDYSSDQADSTFRCTIDTRDVACSGSSATLDDLAPGNHTFTVVASNPDGLADPTAATRHFAVVFNDRVLRQRTKGWQERTNRGAYLRTYLTTNQKNEVLSLEATRMNRLALLVGQAPGFGRLAVYVDGTKVGTVDLEARKATAKVLVLVERFKQPKTGVVTIRTLDGSPVQIDGIGIFQQPRR